MGEKKDETVREKETFWEVERVQDSFHNWYLHIFISDIDSLFYYNVDIIVTAVIFHSFMQRIIKVLGKHYFYRVNPTATYALL